MNRIRVALGIALLIALRANVAGAQVLPGVGMESESAQGEVGAYRAKVQVDLNSILTRWGELTEQKDSASLVGLYTANARSIATGVSDAWSARGVVSQMWQLPLPGAHLYVVIDDFDMSGDMAYVSSVVTISPTAAGGPLNSAIAHAVFVFVCDSRGRWHIRSQSLTIPKSGSA